MCCREDPSILYGDRLYADLYGRYLLGHCDPKGEETMENGKTFATASKHDFCWKTQQEAEDYAKRQTSKRGEEYFVVQAVSQTKVPTPEIELVKIS